MNLSSIAKAVVQHFDENPTIPKTSPWIDGWSDEDDPEQLQNTAAFLEWYTFYLIVVLNVETQLELFAEAVRTKPSPLGEKKHQLCYELDGEWDQVLPILIANVVMKDVLQARDVPRVQ